jgi:hypothetical protein
MSYTPEVTEAASQWMVRHRATEDPAVIAKIVERAQENLERLGGFISPSSMERSYLELVSEGVIKPFRGSLMDKPAAAPAIPPDVIAWIENPRVSAFEQRRRYATDPQFKKYYDLYLNTQLKAKVAAEESEATLTVEAYNAMPRIEVVKRYRSSAGFRRGVDALIARRLI